MTPSSHHEHPERKRRMFRTFSNTTGRRKGTDTLREISRVSTVSGRLQSIFGKRSDGSTYKLLVDSGSSINIIKRNKVPIQSRPFEIRKNFIMGKDKHMLTTAVHIIYLNKRHLFHIVENGFPLPEEGIIGLSFFRKYNRYAITPKFLVIENKKLSLYDDGEYITPYTAQINKIHIPNEIDQEICIENDPHVPDGIYQIKKQILLAPYNKYDRQPLKISILKYECIERINKISEEVIMKVEKSRNNNRIKNLLGKTRLNHVEDKLADLIWNILTQYTDKLRDEYVSVIAKTEVNKSLVLEFDYAQNLALSKLNVTSQYY